MFFISYQKSFLVHKFFLVQKLYTNTLAILCFSGVVGGKIFEIFHSRVELVIVASFIQFLSFKLTKNCKKFTFAFMQSNIKVFIASIDTNSSHFRFFSANITEFYHRSLITDVKFQLVYRSSWT
uniref:(northern house mosquito) hypothetical protein n=1 Tax=Culex pipiens TaxID=7175 RepID=A0A8D8IY75_CULPI